MKDRGRGRCKRAVPAAVLLTAAWCLHGTVSGQMTPAGATATGLAATALPVAAGTAAWVLGDGSPAGPALVVASGVVLGPAIGQWAGGLKRSGWKGAGLRAGLAALSFLPAFAVCGIGCMADDERYDFAWVIIATGTGAGAFSAIHDLSRTSGQMRLRREREGRAAPRMTPYYDPVAREAGAVLVVRF
jgi:hypothetical protein